MMMMMMRPACRTVACSVDVGVILVLIVKLGLQLLSRAGFAF